MRSVSPLASLYESVLNSVLKSKNDDEIEKAIANETQLRLIEAVTKTKGGKDFSRETKTAAFIKDALETAQRCKICGARVHPKSISIDHIVRKDDGGMGNQENAQVTHPYCNTGYKEKRVSESNKS